VAKVAAAAPPSVPKPSEPGAVRTVNPLLLAGVPLVSAALLMGVYWLILRAGAV
jgi:hypothetical protein